MLTEISGGYDEGYKAIKGFWGTSPGSLVSHLLKSYDASGRVVLDVGAGEGKNAAAFAGFGAHVDALECSSAAIGNGRELFPHAEINWIQADVTSYVYPECYYDVIVCYGLIHCLQNEAVANKLVRSLQNSLKGGGFFILASFNNGSHDFSAHPEFEPLLLENDWFLNHFNKWNVEIISNSILFETHPHNLIPHHHSMTRLIAAKP
jgi:SAM-dependent methyltransferase